MTRFEEATAKYKDNYDLYNFLRFVKDGLTTQQCKDALRIDDDEECLLFLLYAYACYRLPRKMGVPHLITNPQALSLSDEERKELVEIMKTAIIEELETVKARQAAQKLCSKKQ